MNRALARLAVLGTMCLGLSGLASCLPLSASLLVFMFYWPTVFYRGIDYGRPTGVDYDSLHYLVSSLV